MGIGAMAITLFSINSTFPPPITLIAITLLVTASFYLLLIKPLILSAKENLRRALVAEEDLNKASIRAETTLNTVATGIISINKDGTILSINNGAAQMFGVISRETIGLNIKEFIPDEMQINHEQHLDDYRHEDRKDSLRYGREMVAKRADGTGFPIWIAINEMHLDDDVIFVSSIMDLSDQKAIEEMFRMSESRSRAILETAINGIITFNEDGQLRSFNPAAKSMFGYELDEIIGKDMHCLIEESQHDKYNLFITECIASEKADHSRHEEFSGIRKDGSIFQFWINVGIAKQGDDWLFVGIITDITDQKKSEYELKKRSNAIEASPVGVVITDKQSIVEYVNPSFSTISGYSSEEIIGKNIRIIQSDHTSSEVYDEMLSQLAAGKTWQGELLNRRKDERLYWTNTSISPIKNDLGEITHHVAIQEDITQRKRADEELRQHRDHLEDLVTEQTADLIAAKETAETASHSKSAFLANTSHEIRTPMNAIIGMTELVLETELSAEQRQHLETVDKSAKSLLQLLNQILDLSKLEGGKMDIEHTLFDINEVTEESLLPFHSVAKQKGIDLILKVNPNIQACRYGDPTKIRQIIINLVGNAIKFTEHGSVTISISPNEINGRLHFSVTDTGIGIPENRIKSIFESFTQADQSTARKYGGTGLGTTISKQFVEMMGGEIWIESVVNQGTTFHFTLPIQIAAGVKSCRSEDSHAKKQLQAKKPLNILLVDDVAINIKLAKIRLEKSGHHVTTAINGKEATEKHKEGSFDLILMDIQMPEMNGFEATAAIRKAELPQKHHTPIIAMTANAMKEDQEECLKAGMDSFVSKPIDFRVLTEKIAEIIPDIFE